MLTIKKIKPMFTSVVTTMNKYENDVLTTGGLIDTSKQVGSLKEYQTILAVGDSVRNMKVGDVVCVNPTRFGMKKHREGSLKDGIITDNPIITYNFDIIVINNEKCLILRDTDIDFIIEEYEETPDTPSKVIKPDNSIII